MLDAGTFTRSRRLIEHMCQLDLDARTLRRQIVEELRQVVAFQAHAWLLTDPVTAVGAAPVADVPWMRELPRQIRLKYCTGVNRWTAWAPLRSHCCTKRAQATWRRAWSGETCSSDKAIFAKTFTRSRRTLLSRALGS